jgi:hypothetical protein
MNVAERAAYEARIAELEGALTNYLRITDMTSFKVSGDLRVDFLAAYARCLVALPGYRRPPTVEEIVG